MPPPAARPWKEPPWSCSGRISGTYRCVSPTLRGQHAVRSAKPWLFRGRPDTLRRWFGSNLVGRRVVDACGAPFGRHVSASTRTPQSVLDILENPSLFGSRSIDATVRFCDDKVETNRPRVDGTDVRAEGYRHPVGHGTPIRIVVFVLWLRMIPRGSARQALHVERLWVSSRTHHPGHQTADGFRRRCGAASNIYAGNLFLRRAVDVSSRRREP